VDGSFVTSFARARSLLTLAAGAVVLLAAPALLGARAAAGELRVQGELTGAAVDNRDDRWSPGTITVGTHRIVVPPRLLIELPGAALTLQELFVLAPERCRKEGASGLLASDACRVDRDGSQAKRPWSPRDDTTPRSTLEPEPTGAPPATMAHVTAVAGDGSASIATKIVLTRDDRSVFGAVTFVSEEQGYLRIGGAFGVDLGGALVRINDPDARQSAQRGVGCGSEGNCSPDARFRADVVHHSVRFEEGYPACVPGALGDVCSAASRPVRGIVDAALLLPIRPGDHVTAQGAFEIVDGARIFSAHTLVDHTSPLAPGR
jgi:hypothetical protein